MHATLITFESTASPEELAAPFQEYARALRKQPGLISKTWIRTSSGYGGFHVFSDRDAADQYLGSDLAAGLMATNGFDNFQVTQYEVLDELSTMTGITHATT